MCILFIYNGSHDEECDYSLIVAANRDEYYRRPSQNLGPWSEDASIIGGRDLEENCGGGTWLAISPLQKKIGVLLNLPGSSKLKAKTRGRIVADFVKNKTPVSDYIDHMRSYMNECNEFVFIAVELGNLSPSIYSYSNATDKLANHTDSCLGFGNSLPDNPLKKVEAGRTKLVNICKKLNKISMKDDLVKELIGLLKSEERNLPDTELERRRPTLSQYLSSIFVCIPEEGYGTRTHTIILVSKTGNVDVIEITLQPPVDVHNPNWHRTDLQFDIKSHMQKL